MTKSGERKSPESRLADYYRTELRVAEIDVRRDNWRRRRRTGGPLGLAAAVVAGAVLGISLAQVTGLGTPIEPATAGPSTPAARPSGVSAKDDVPTSIDGRPVLRDAAIREMVSVTDDDRRFLVAGWLVFVYPDCTPDSQPVDLMDPCKSGPYLVDQPLDPFEPKVPGDLLRVVISRLASAPSTDGPSSEGPFVFEVHIHDPAAADCPADRFVECSIVLVADQVLWSK